MSNLNIDQGKAGVGCVWEEVISQYLVFFHDLPALIPALADLQNGAANTRSKNTRRNPLCLARQISKRTPPRCRGREERRRQSFFLPTCPFSLLACQPFVGSLASKTQREDLSLVRGTRKRSPIIQRMGVGVPIFCHSED